MRNWFDYCFNYFQSSRESGATSKRASSSNFEASCLQLGFYLASWGMYRGSAILLQESSRFLVPLVNVIGQAGASLWEIDAHSYTDTNIARLCELARKFRQAYPEMADALLTKIMLGVFACVPAFDTNFRRGCKVAGIPATFGPNSLGSVGTFYNKNAVVIDEFRVPTLDFVSGKPTDRKYTRAKVIDMALFMEGWLLSNSALT